MLWLIWLVPRPCYYFLMGDDRELFERAMAGVAPIEQRDRVTPAREGQRVVGGEEAALPGSGGECFEVSGDTAHIQGVSQGTDRRLLRKLRKGGYPLAASLDLHGQTRKQAQVAVERFLAESRRRGQRCVLIVVGRGLHSKDGMPVLKESLTLWLTQGDVGRSVLAFCSARPSDGGLGAVYVLLRR